MTPGARRLLDVASAGFFLGRIRTHRLAFEGDARVERSEGNFEGNFEDCEDRTP